jgi:hypothetical protein
LNEDSDNSHKLLSDLIENVQDHELEKFLRLQKKLGERKQKAKKTE